MHTPKQRAIRHNAPWSDDEKLLLTSQLKWGWTLKDIAQDHQRSPDAIKCQLIKRIVEDGESPSRYPFITPKDIAIFKEQRDKRAQTKLEANEAKHKLITEGALAVKILDVGKLIKEIYKDETIIEDYDILVKKDGKMVEYTFDLFFIDYNLAVGQKKQKYANITMPKGYSNITYDLNSMSLGQCIREINNTILNKALA